MKYSALGGGDGGWRGSQAKIAPEVKNLENFLWFWKEKIFVILVEAKISSSMVKPLTVITRVRKPSFSYLPHDVPLYNIIIMVSFITGTTAFNMQPHIAFFAFVFSILPANLAAPLRSQCRCVLHVVPSDISRKCTWWRVILYYGDCSS